MEPLPELAQTDALPTPPQKKRVKPRCMACGSYEVRYREKDKTLGCRRCGARRKTRRPSGEVA